ncbi:MAG: hypothetical protein QOG42_1054 [Solirubrobacteraceae bacterium]|jgi:hypothetical protein|nr:hypothetical protein [Solirubrobacteraceae bacterium]
MLCAIIAASTSHGIWDNDTVGLVFVWVILLPAIVTGLIVVASVSGRGDKKTDDEMRGRWGRKRPPSGS